MRDLRSCREVGVSPEDDLVNLVDSTEFFEGTAVELQLRLNEIRRPAGGDYPGIS